MALESVLIAGVIDDHKGQDAAVADVPGAYLQTDTNEETWMALDSELA